jgi:hypothetical protein
MGLLLKHNTIEQEQRYIGTRVIQLARFGEIEIHLTSLEIIVE